MKITDLVSSVIGDPDIRTQLLPQCMTRAMDRSDGTTEIGFLTQNLRASDLTGPTQAIGGPRYTALILWIPLALYRRVTTSPHQDTPTVTLDDVRAELAKHLSPGNENVTQGDVLASIRDLAQIAVSATGNCLELEKQLTAALARVEALEGEKAA